MKKIIKKCIYITLLIIILTIINETEVKAALQANPNTHYKYTDTITNWVRNFRKMETSGEAMGLNETLNTDLTASSESNNIDVHMMKPTEYGAILILSASGYGNPSNDVSITSTTGNNTGLQINTTLWEWVAGGLNIPPNVNAIYWDKYTTDRNSAKRGDGLGNETTTNPGTANWHSAEFNNWLTGTYPYILRGKSGYFSIGYEGNSRKEASRGVAVCGENL
ncbi:MAG: hypothetical protein HFJ53_02385 [Clostridia bacterium]|jgi:hypothetical protein|nr:hypothetical protein [Clostridia bacterium]